MRLRKFCSIIVFSFALALSVEAETRMAIAPESALAQNDFCGPLRNLSGPVTVPHITDRFSFSSTWERLYDLCISLPKTADYQSFYHWGPLEECIFPAVNGFYPKSELEQQVQSDYYFKEGGGFYISDYPFDTTQYGSCRIDLVLPPGVPLLRNRTIIQEKLGLIAPVEPQTGAWVGTVVPFLHFRYVLDWSVIHTEILLTDMTGARSMRYNDDIWNTLFLNMYPTYSGLAKGPQVEAVNKLVPLLRRFLLTFLSSDIFSFAAASLNRPEAPWLEAIPNTTESDWDVFDKVIANMFKLREKGLGRSACLFGDGQSPEQWQDFFVDSVVPAVMGFSEEMKSPSHTIENYFRQSPFIESDLIATQSQLNLLLRNPLVSVRYQTLPPIVSSSNITIPIWNVQVRGISAFDPQDWKNLLSSGFLAQNDTIFKILQDPPNCCAQNKTQLLISAVLRSFASKIYMRSAEDQLNNVIEALRWIMPFSNEILPHWMSKSAMNYTGFQILSSKCFAFVKKPTSRVWLPQSFHYYLDARSMELIQNRLEFPVGHYLFSNLLQNSISSALFQQKLFDPRSLSTMPGWQSALRKTFEPLMRKTANKIDWTSYLGPAGRMANFVKQRNWPALLATVLPSYSPSATTRH